MRFLGFVKVEYLLSEVTSLFHSVTGRMSMERLPLCFSDRPFPSMGENYWTGPAA